MPGRSPAAGRPPAEAIHGGGRLWPCGPPIDTEVDGYGEGIADSYASSVSIPSGEGSEDSYTSTSVSMSGRSPAAGRPLGVASYGGGRLWPCGPPIDTEVDGYGEAMQILRVDARVQPGSW